MFFTKINIKIMETYDFCIEKFNKKRTSRKKEITKKNKMNKLDFYDNLESATFNIY